MGWYYVYCVGVRGLILDILLFRYLGVCVGWVSYGVFNYFWVVVDLVFINLAACLFIYLLLLIMDWLV